MKSYDFEYNEKLLYYEENSKRHPEIYKKPTYFYYKRVTEGLWGIAFYANPFLAIPVAIKEIYRLEVYLRNLEDEKKKRDYYRIL